MSLINLQHFCYVGITENKLPGVDRDRGRGLGEKKKCNLKKKEKKEIGLNKIPNCQKSHQAQCWMPFGKAGHLISYEN